jgi:hypothetical protein
MQFLSQNWALVAVLAAVAFVFWLARATVDLTEPPYEKRGSLLNSTELKFYKALQAAIGGSWTLLTLVPLHELIHVKADTPGASQWREKLSGQQLDFVLCNNDSLEVLLAIELNDPPPSNASAAPLGFMPSALAAAGIPLWRVTVAESYDKIELRKQLDALLSGKKKK